MRLVIDLQGLQNLSADRGIGRYTRYFAKALLRNKKLSSESLDIYILLNSLFSTEIAAIKQEFSGLIAPQKILVFDVIGPNKEAYDENLWRIKASELIREKFIQDLSPDFLIICSHMDGFLDETISSIHTFSQIPTAVILYDLIPHIYPEQYLGYGPIKKWYVEKIESLKKADLLLAISRSAKEEGIKYLNREEKSIITISSAVNEDFNQTAVKNKTEQAILKQFNITRPFIMHTSAYEERKNFEGLIQAFSQIPSNLRKGYQLVLICKLKPEQKQHLAELAEEYGLSDDELILTGFISDENLILLYRACYLFVFPSLHEGFGLPALEAMSCGTATIGSNLSSIPEVIGRKDAMFDPSNTESICNKIIEVLENEEFWLSLKQHALTQSKKFSWDKTAQIALKAIELANKQNKNDNNAASANDVYTNTTKLLEAISKLPGEYSEQDLINCAEVIGNNEKTIHKLQSYSDEGGQLKWRIEGPFDSSYSLALLNRETAIALNSLGHHVALHSTEGPGDFTPNKNYLEENPELNRLYQQSKKITHVDADICSRNLYPPRVSDMHAKINMLHHYAWEESGFVMDWVKDFNQYLDGLTCLSNHVYQILINHGVHIPMTITGSGVDHWERIKIDKSYKLKAKEFRFLHVSSCFPRKGADVLLKSYGESFTAQDNVSLIIKTFKNPHNEIFHWLEQAKKEQPQYPDVIIIEEDLSNETLKSLYQQCHVLVGPSRAEGFGLPFAEAMLSGLAVITTGWGGQLDFCNKNNSWLIDYKFTQAKTHFNLADSVWAEPSQQHLSELMREVFELPLNKRQQRSNKAREALLNDYKWADVASRLVQSMKEVTGPQEHQELNIGWISSWNTKCGIASYSEHLINNMNLPVTIFAAKTNDKIAADTDNVYRCWDVDSESRHPFKELQGHIEHLSINSIVLQFNYSFFDFEKLASFLKQQRTQNRKVILMLHATQDAEIRQNKKLINLIPEFKQCSRVLVHSIEDLNRLKNYGLVENAALFPHGLLDYEPAKYKQKSNNEKTTIFTLATYGFLLPHKGLLELIDTFIVLQDKLKDTKSKISIKLNMMNAEYPVEVSALLKKQVISKIKANKVEQDIILMTDYQTDSESLNQLSKADLIIFPYQVTGESSSAAVRYGLSSQVPVAVTPLNIFDDVKSVVFKLPGCGIEEMSKGLLELVLKISIQDKEIEQKNKRIKGWLKSRYYSALGTRLNNILSALQHNNA